MESDVVGSEDGAADGAADAMTVATTNVVRTPGIAGGSTVLDGGNICLVEEAPSPDDIAKLEGVESDGCDKAEDILDGSVEELTGVPGAGAVTVDKRLVENKDGATAGGTATEIPLDRLVDIALLEGPTEPLGVGSTEAIGVVEKGIPATDAIRLFEVDKEAVLVRAAIDAVMRVAIAGEIGVMGVAVVSETGVDDVVMTVDDDTDVSDNVDREDDEDESGGKAVESESVLAAARITGAAPDLELARVDALGTGEESSDKVVKAEVEVEVGLTELELELRMSDEEFWDEGSLPAVVLVEERTWLGDTRDEEANRLGPAAAVEVVIMEGALVLV